MSLLMIAFAIVYKVWRLPSYYKSQYLKWIKYFIPCVVNLNDLRKICFLLVNDSIIVFRNSSAMLFLFISFVLKKFLLLIINKQAIFSRTLWAKLFHLFSFKYLYLLNLLSYLKFKEKLPQWWKICWSSLCSKRILMEIP